MIENYRGLALYPLLPAEVVLPNDSFFLDEESRWGGIARYSCPGRFSAGEKSKLQKLAQKVHYLLGLRHYSSSEFIIHPRRGIFFIEVDALPCLGVNISPYRESLLAVGIPTAHFLNHVLESALQER
ncbi:MAG: D-alanine-D-alanine ligase [Parcubacteria group bacterium GW2011_GWF2_50_9]|nr:MAG: D-alanine-D-alanine ligase [Parcubacteria group bacterium GW2011_GWF2_50_9]